MTDVYALQEPILFDHFEQLCKDRWPEALPADV